MKQLIIVSTALFLAMTYSSCQKIEGNVTHKYDDYLVEFNADIARLGYQPIDFSETVIRENDNLKPDDGPTLGYCHSIELKHEGPANISVSTRLATYGHDIATALIYHELGHCFLGLDHTKTHSIMNGGNLRTFFTYAEMTDESKRLALVKEMLQNSSYR